MILIFSILNFKINTMFEIDKYHSNIEQVLTCTSLFIVKIKNKQSKPF